MPLDDATALALARQLPWFAPAERDAKPLDPAELGRDPVHDLLLLERAARAPAAIARESLRRAADAVARGALSGSTAVTIAFLRGRRDRLDDAAPLFEESLLPLADRATFARGAFDRLVTQALTHRQGAAVSALELELVARHPELPGAQLDAAAALAEAGDLAAADAAFRAVQEEARGALDTAALLRHGSATLGRAWLALLRDGEARLELAWPRAALPHEDALHALQLRAALVAAFVGAARGGCDRAALAAALDAAPVDAQRSIVDEAWFGACGPLLGKSLLRAADRSDAWCAGALEVVAAVEASHARHGHGLLGRQRDDDDADHERPASWCFLTAAEALLVDRGDPAAALALLEARRAPAIATRSWGNQELACELELVAARAALYAGDARRARDAADSALRLARELHAGAARDLVQRAAAGEAPPPPMALLIGRAETSYASLVARALATRSGIRATLEGDVDGAAQDLLDSGAGWAWDATRWLRHATDFARRGRLADVRACVARVELSPDHAYDLACISALGGEREEAFARLEEHLEGIGRSPAVRKLELDYAARDLDLAALRDDARFPRR